MDVVSVDSAKKNPQLIPKTSTSSTKAQERWEDKHVRLLIASYMKFKDEFTILTKRMDTPGNYLQGLYPFSETIFHDFSRLQIDLSRTPKFTLTLSLTEVTINLFLLAISTHYQTYQ